MNKFDRLAKAIFDSQVFAATYRGGLKPCLPGLAHRSTE